jgi:lysozyme
MHPENAKLKISKEGIELIKHFEGLFLKAYRCPANVLTIGYGHTGITHNDGTVKRGGMITEVEAEQLLKLDLGKVGLDVKRLVKLPLEQHQFDALVSFQFNLGKLGQSSLLRRLNAGDDVGAAGEFPRWVYAAGNRLSGLVRRRAAERAMFEGGNWRAWTK